MASRILAQILVMGGGFVARAFAEAYRQALANAARSGGGAARGGATSGRSAAANRAKISPDEATKILALPPEPGLKDVLTRYERMYAANDPGKGGSAYLQAKIASAKYLLDQEAIARGETPPPPPADHDESEKTEK